MLIIGPFVNFQISSWRSFFEMARKTYSIPKTKLSSPGQTRRKMETYQETRSSIGDNKP